MSSEKGRNFDELMLSEERSAQRWMRRFVIAAPIVTAPLFLFPLLSWLGFSKISIFASAVYFFLIFMTEWSYLKASFGTPGRVPSSWELADDEVYVYPEANSDSIPLYRYCDICDLPKPPRTAHCKYCEKCTPKMDHHCAWTANCVGEKNHKAFLLFVVYMLLLSSYIVAITLLRIVALVLNSSEEVHPSQLSPGQAISTIFVMVLAIPTVGGVASVLFAQVSVIKHNHTLLERLAANKLSVLAQEANVHWTWKFVAPYSHGAKVNFMDVFGYSSLYWFLPISEDGKNEFDINHWTLNPHYKSPDLSSLHSDD